MKNEKSNFKVKSIKFNLDEYSKVEKMLNDENIKFATFVKNKIFDDNKTSKEKIIKRLKLKTSIEKNQAKYEFNQELKRIGNNLNQIAKNCNQTKSIDFLALKKLDEILKELKELNQW